MDIYVVEILGSLFVKEYIMLKVVFIISFVVYEMLYIGNVKMNVSLQVYGEFGKIILKFL